MGGLEDDHEEKAQEEEGEERALVSTEQAGRTQMLPGT